MKNLVPWSESGDANSGAAFYVMSDKLGTRCLLSERPASLCFEVSMANQAEKARE